MKRCPKCRRDYYDESLLYCLDDGSMLLDGPGSVSDPASVNDPVTAILHSTARPEGPAKGLPEGADKRSNRKTPTTLTWLGIAGVLALVLASVGYIYYFREGSADKIDSVAVMPFSNQGGSASLEYLSDGMTETLISSLAQDSSLRVQSRNTVFRYKGKELHPKTIASELAVQAVLTGNISQRGADISIYVELIDAETEKTIWGQTYSRPMANILTIENEIARDVKNRLRSQPVDMTGGPKRYPQNSEAYKLYLQGRYHFNKYSEEGLRKGIEYFDKAVENDPGYALAYAGLADSYISLGNDYMPPKNAYPLAKTYALKALELDGRLAEAHASLGAINFFYDWDWAAARRELEQVMELNPDTTEPYACTLHYSDAVGGPESAVDRIRLINDRHPTSLIINAEIGCASYYARKYEQAVSESQKTVALDPNYAPAFYNAGRAYGQQAKYDDAATALNKAVSLLDGKNHAVAELAYIYAVSGKREKALSYLGELDRIGKGRYVDPYLRAIVYAGMRDKEMVLKLLEQAYNERSTWMPWLRLEPKFDSFRSEPAFKSLIDRMKFEG